MAALALAVAIPFTILGVKTSGLKTDYAYLKDDEDYCSRVEV